MDEFRFFQSESMFFSILTDDLISKENFIRKLFIPTSEKSHQIASRLPRSTKPINRFLENQKEYILLYHV